MDQFRFFNIVAGLFVFFALSRAYLRYRDGIIKLNVFLLWFIFWAGAGIFIFYPGYGDRLAERLGVQNGADVVVYTSIIVLYYLIFRIYVFLGVIRQEMTELIRQMALHEEEKSDN